MNTLDKLQKTFPESYRKGNVLLINADCMDVMKLLDDKEFCLACVDPPYGIGMDGGSVGYKGFNVFEKKSWDSKIPSDDYFQELQRISKGQIVWGGNYFNLPPSRCFLIWDKGAGFKDRSYAECEQAWTSFDANAKIYKRDPLACGDYKGKIHPTQKPVALYEWLLANYAKKGQRILDTHLGSGSSAIAAHYFGVDFVGCELDKDYFEAAKARFDMATRQLALSV
jgi:site-specific DNA-methyltransferase (adenine-specific)